MAGVKRRSKATAVALSIATHAVVLTALALHAPRLVRPYELAGPPEPVIPVLLMPRTPPAPPGATEKPKPIRLHRRQLRPDIPETTVAPFVVPASIATPRPAPPKRIFVPRVSVQPSPAAQVATALRGGLVGCANPSLLSQIERDRCQERLGRGAAETPHLGPAFNSDFARASAQREANRRATLPPGFSGPTSDPGASNRDPPVYLPLPPRR
jgi:hypothetical protein